MSRIFSGQKPFILIVGVVVVTILVAGATPYLFSKLDETEIMLEKGVGEETISYVNFEEQGEKKSITDFTDMTLLEYGNETEQEMSTKSVDDYDTNNNNNYETNRNELDFNGVNDSKSYSNKISSTDQELLWSHDEHNSGIQGIDKNGSVVYSIGFNDGSGNGRVIAYDIESESVIWEHTEHTGYGRCLVEDNGIVYSGGNDNRVIAYDVDTESVLWENTEHSDNVLDLDVENGVVYSGDNSNKVIAYDVDSETVLWEHTEHTDSVQSVYVKDGIVYSGGNDNKVIAYDTETESVLWEHTEHTSGIRGISSEGNDTLFSISLDEVIAYDIESESVIWEHTEHSDDGKCLDYEEGVVYTGAKDNKVIAYDIESESVFWEHTEHSDIVQSIYIEDGIAYSGSSDQNLIAYGEKEVNINITNEFPSDSLTQANITELSFDLNHSKGSLMDYTIETFPDVGSISEDDVDNGTYSCSVSDLESDQDYEWYVNVTDGDEWYNKTYEFTTKPFYYGLEEKYPDGEILDNPFIVDDDDYLLDEPSIIDTGEKLRAFFLRSETSNPKQDRGYVLANISYDLSSYEIWGDDMSNYIYSHEDVPDTINGNDRDYGTACGEGYLHPLSDGGYIFVHTVGATEDWGWGSVAVAYSPDNIQNLEYQDLIVPTPTGDEEWYGNPQIYQEDEDIYFTLTNNTDLQTIDGNIELYRLNDYKNSSVDGDPVDAELISEIWNGTEDEYKSRSGFNIRKINDKYYATHSVDDNRSLALVRSDELTGDWTHQYTINDEPDIISNHDSVISENYNTSYTIFSGQGPGYEEGDHRDLNIMTAKTFIEEDLEEFTLTIESQDYGYTVPSEGTHVYEDGDEVDIEAISDTGYHFNKWSGDNETIEDTSSNDTVIEITGNHTILAEFDPNIYTLTIDSSDNGNVTYPGEGTFEYEYNSEVDLFADNDYGYHFDKWIGDNDTIDDVESHDTNITIPSENISITANFEVNVLELTVEVKGDGSELNYGEGTHEIEYDELVELEADEDSGWYFVNWDGYAYSTDRNVSFDMPNEDVTITATFEEKEETLRVEVYDKISDKRIILHIDAEKSETAKFESYEVTVSLRDINEEEDKVIVRLEVKHPRQEDFMGADILLKGVGIFIIVGVLIALIIAVIGGSSKL